VWLQRLFCADAFTRMPGQAAVLAEVRVLGVL